MKNVFYIFLFLVIKVYFVNYINKNDFCYGEDSIV